MATLRQALGDGQDGNRYVVNVPGRGYRFVAAISDRSAPRRMTPQTIAATGSHNLPMPLTRLFGRADMVSAIAYTLAPSYRVGCRFLDLAPLSDHRLVPSALAVLLGIGAHSDNLIPNLLAYLQGKQILIVLDSGEHIIDAAAVFAEQLHVRNRHQILLNRSSRGNSKQCRRFERHRKTCLRAQSNILERSAPVLS